MPDQDPSQTLRSQIADAIRAKREPQSSKLIAEELAAMEASLLADLDGFDPEAVARAQDSEAKKSASARTQASPELSFPSINPEANRNSMSETPRPASGPAATPTSAARSGGSLLEQLRQKAEAQQQHLNVQHEQLSAMEIAADQALRQVFAYLHELGQQLNVLKPAISRTYPLVSQLELNELTWHQGFSDYRSRPDSAGSLMEFVSLNYRLSGNRGLEIERDGSVAENFRKFLFDYNLNFTVEEFRNERRYLERARFIVAPEIKVSTRWEADLQTGNLVILTRNLERLGSARYIVRPERINQSLLDEFARLILGEPQQFARLASR